MKTGIGFESKTYKIVTKLGDTLSKCFRNDLLVFWSAQQKVKHKVKHIIYFSPKKQVHAKDKIFKAILYISCKINPLTGNQTLWRPVTFSPGSLQSALEWVLDGLWWLVQEREQYGWQFADWSYKAISMWCCVTVWLLKPGYLEVDKIIQSQNFLEKQRILKIFCNGPITFKYISTMQPLRNLNCYWTFLTSPETALFWDWSVSL